MTVRAIVDTGSDCTFLPYDILASLQCLPNDSCIVEGITGAEELRALYSVDLEFHQRRFPTFTVVEQPSAAEAIVGRDFIQAFRLEFNGPQSYLAVIP